jgi:hypothetical protein
MLDMNSTAAAAVAAAAAAVDARKAEGMKVCSSSPDADAVGTSAAPNPVLQQRGQSHEAAASAASTDRLSGQQWEKQQYNTSQQFDRQYSQQYSEQCSGELVMETDHQQHHTEQLKKEQRSDCFDEDTVDDASTNQHAGQQHAHRATALLGQAPGQCSAQCSEQYSGRLSQQVSEQYNVEQVRTASPCNAASSGQLQRQCSEQYNEQLEEHPSEQYSENTSEAAAVPNGFDGLNAAAAAVEWQAQCSSDGGGETADVGAGREPAAPGVCAADDAVGCAATVVRQQHQLGNLGSELTAAVSVELHSVSGGMVSSRPGSLTEQVSWVGGIAVDQQTQQADKASEQLTEQYSEGGFEAAESAAGEAAGDA